MREALRALAADFDTWAGLGLSWSWQRVLDSYRRLETDQDFPDDSYHGADGAGAPMTAALLAQSSTGPADVEVELDRDRAAGLTHP